MVFWKGIEIIYWITTILSNILFLPEIFGMRCHWLFLLIVLPFLSGCGPSLEERAAIRIGLARQLLERQDTLAAMQQLDSIQILFPGAPVAVRSAQALTRELHWDIFHRKQVELDTVNLIIDRLMSHFDSEKNEWQRYRVYVHMLQNLQQRGSHSFLMAEVDEKGNLTLISNFSGGWPYHTRVKVSDGVTEAVTDSVAVGDSYHHQGMFLDARWERITFRDGRENGVIGWIAGNAGKKIKITFVGRQSAVVWLEERDQSAIRESFELASALRKRQILTAEINSLQLKY